MVNLIIIILKLSQIILRQLLPNLIENSSQAKSQVGILQV
jgi:hypothetical protein